MIKAVMNIRLTLALLISFFNITFSVSAGAEKSNVDALYIPLADHYAILVAYERYRDKMLYADFSIEQMTNWDLLQAKFQQGQADMALMMAPLAMDMYQKHQGFKWIGLAHRDGNGLAVSHQIANELNFSAQRSNRKPSKELADVIRRISAEESQLLVGVPHVKSTHSLILFQFLREHGISMSLSPNVPAEVLVIPVAPPKSPAFVLGKNNRSKPAAIEQSLPWIDIVETDNYGWLSWYSKDVLPSEKGHVECIVLANDAALATKPKAIDEVFRYIKIAGQDIENARSEGGKALEEIVSIVQKHIPGHSRKAILASLSTELQVINYQHLDIDKPGLQQIMELAIEAGVLQQPINISEFAHGEQ